jgi:hypothetical protein
VDLQGILLDPLCAQPFDEDQIPFYRQPAGSLVSRDGTPVTQDTQRCSKSGQQLDFYHRLLPPGALLMYACDPKEPIGVGVDGKHYAYPSGREFTTASPHYDVNEFIIPKSIVETADQIISPLKIAFIIQSGVISTRFPHLVFDAFGRPLKRLRDGTLVTKEGQPLGQGAAVFNILAERIEYIPPPKGVFQKLEIRYYDNDSNDILLGTITIEEHFATLADVFFHLRKCISTKMTNLTLLIDAMPLTDKDREIRSVFQFFVFFFFLYFLYFCMFVAARADA